MVFPPEFKVVSLSEVKKWLGITGVSSDQLLNDLIVATTYLIEEYTHSAVITRKFTHYMDVPLRCKEIYLPKYPVYVNSDFKLYNDVDREFPADSEITDYFIEPSYGRVLFDTTLSPGMGALKAVYWAGFSRFHIRAGVNDSIVISENGGSDVTVTVTEGEYTAEDLASAVETALNNSTSLSGTYSVSYSHATQKFTVSVTGLTSVTYKWTSSSIATTMGYTADSTSFSSESDNEVNGVPNSLKIAGIKIIATWYEESGKGKSILNLESEIIEQGGTRKYVRDELPIGVKTILDQYTIV